MRSARFVFVITLILLFTPWISPLSAELIVLKNGSLIEAKIVGETKDKLTVSLGTGVFYLDRSEVELIINNEYVPDEPFFEEDYYFEEEITPDKTKPIKPVVDIEVAKPTTSTDSSVVPVTVIKISDEGRTPEQKEINKVLSEISEADPKSAWSFMPQLVEKGKADVVYLSGVLQGLSDPFLIRLLIFSLGQIKDEAALPVLKEKLNDNDESIRSSAVSSLTFFVKPTSNEGFSANIGESMKIKAILKSMLEEDPSPAVRFQIINAFGKWKDVSVMPYLVNLLGDKDKQIRVAASDALIKFHGLPSNNEGEVIDIIPLLLEKLSLAIPMIGDDSPSFMRKEIISIFGSIKDKRCQEVLIEMITDRDPETRSLAAQALGGIADKDTIKFLIERVQVETDTWTKIQIMHVFQKQTDYSSIPVLIELVGDSDETISMAASRALRNITKRSFGANYDRWKEWWDTIQGKK